MDLRGESLPLSSSSPPFFFLLLLFFVVLFLCRWCCQFRCRRWCVSFFTFDPSCAYLWVAVDVGNYNEKNEAKPDTAPKRRKTENVVRVLMFLSVVVNPLGGRGCFAHAPVAFLLSVLSLARWSVLDQS